MTTAFEIVLPGVVEPAGLQTRHRELPPLARGELRVDLQATGVSFAETSMRRGRYPGQPRFPFVPGYDIVGRVAEVGPGVDGALVGQTVAAVTKTGGWASAVVLDAANVVGVPEAVTPEQAETVLVNGVTAIQMLRRTSGARGGDVVLVHGAAGGVGSVLVQLARHDGIRVLATASPRDHDALRALGAEPIDYHDDVAARVRALAPDGVAAVFDHLGGDSFARSFGLLAPGGTLVGYGTATQRDGTNNLLVTFAGIFGRFAWWSAKRNGARKARFYNFWGGSKATPQAFRRRFREDLAAVLGLVADGTIEARVAERVPLAEAGRALTLAESRTVSGKIVIVP